VKLADFGSCTELDSKKLTVVGTPYWMAPEIVQVTGAVFVSDIWSVACTVIELQSGAPPYFEHGTMGALYRMVEDAHPPIPKGCSVDLEEFLRKCFIKDTSRRPTAAQVLTHRWLKCTASGGVIQSKADVKLTIRQFHDNSSSGSNSAGKDPLNTNINNSTVSRRNTAALAAAASSSSSSAAAAAAAPDLQLIWAGLPEDVRSILKDIARTNLEKMKLSSAQHDLEFQLTSLQQQKREMQKQIEDLRRRVEQATSERDVVARERTVYQEIVLEKEQPTASRSKR